MIKNNNDLIKAYCVLWKIMSLKERAVFVLLTFLVTFRSFAIISTTQILACLVDVISGQVGTIWGIGIPTTWTSVQVVIFTYILITIIWVLCAILNNYIKKYSVSMACKVNEKVLDIIDTPRKNLDFKMANGEAVYIANSAGESVIYLIKDIWLKILVPIISCFISLIFIAQIDIISFAIFFICFLLIFISSLIRLKFESKYQNKIEKSKSNINNLFLNNVENIPIIVLSNSQKHEKEVLYTNNKEYKKQWYGVTNMTTGYWILAYLIQYVLIACGILACILRNGLGLVNLANIVALVSYASQLCSPLENVGVELGQLQLRAVQFNRLSLLNVDELIGQTGLKQQKMNPPKNIKIEAINIEKMNVEIGTFKKDYKDVTFSSNMINVVCGDSGGGKSVLIGALLGIKTYKTATININKKYAINSLYDYKNKVSYVPQHSIIFDREIEENVAYPNNKLTKTMKKYVKKFGLEDLLLKKNTNTDIIKTLSGGEQKRISLIRGFSKKADVYIFDEPTNDLDNTNVSIFIDEVMKLKNNAIVVIISHDKRIFDIADNLINVDIE